MAELGSSDDVSSVAPAREVGAGQGSAQLPLEHVAPTRVTLIRISEGEGRVIQRAPVGIRNQEDAVVVRDAMPAILDLGGDVGCRESGYRSLGFFPVSFENPPDVVGVKEQLTSAHRLQPSSRGRLTDSSGSVLGRAGVSPSA